MAIELQTLCITLSAGLQAAGLNMAQNVVQLTVGGRAVLVPISTIGSLASGVEPVTAPKRLTNGQLLYRSLLPSHDVSCSGDDLCSSVSDDNVYCKCAYKTGANAGHSRGLLEGSYACDAPRNIGRQSSEESSQFHEELASLTSAMTQVQEVFTQLLENFDACTPHSEQQARAMGELWSFYDSHADELEAGAAELGSVLRTRHLSALGQTAMHRVTTLPAALSFAQQAGSPEHVNRAFEFSGKQQAYHRRSHSFS